MYTAYDKLHIRTPYYGLISRLNGAEKGKFMQDQELLQKVDHWAAAEPVREHVLMAGEKVTPVVSAALLAGPKRGEALARATKIKSASPSEQAKLLKDDMVSGCSTILNFARKKSGFDPAKINDPSGKEKFAAYLSKVQAAPFFFLQFARAVSVSNKSKNWDQLIDAIADTFTGIAEENKAAVVKSLGSLAKVAASTEDTKQTEDMFVQSVLYAGEEIEIYLYSSHVEMESHKEKGSTSKQSLFEVKTMKLRLLKELWPTVSDRVAGWGVKAVDDWENEDTTRQGGLTHNLCIGANV